jgi:AraC-like DNA-binding protein
LQNKVATNLITFADRPSDSPFIERVWRSHSERAGVFHSMAACHWVMVVTRLEGKAYLTVRGPETKATMADLPAQGEWFGVLFKLGTFMPLMRSGDLRDRNDVTLPNATGRSFWLNGSAWEFPNFENMETFVNRLVRSGLIQTDRIVEGALRGELQKVTTRTEQRRVLQVTGLTRGAIHQIERARRATLLLKRGTPILDVVHEAGYYDQAHLTRSLQRFVGQSPARIARGEEQLSLLYNNEPS